jgi:hypothetical protein
VFKIFSDSRCFAPVTRDAGADFVGLSVFGEKLASGNGDGGIYATLTSSRAVFNFLTLAVRKFQHKQHLVILLHQVHRDRAV